MAQLNQPIKRDSINLQKTLFISMLKINFTTLFLLVILQRFCKLAILGTLGITSYTHQN